MKNIDKDIFQYLIRVYYIRQAIKNTIELCKINIFYSHKISVSKKYVSPSLVKIHPVWKKYPEITCSVHDLIIKIPN